MSELNVSCTRTNGLRQPFVGSVRIHNGGLWQAKLERVFQLGYKTSVRKQSQNPMEQIAGYSLSTFNWRTLPWNLLA
jgi:hypothetical protein